MGIDNCLNIEVVLAVIEAENCASGDQVSGMVAGMSSARKCYGVASSSQVVKMRFFSRSFASIGCSVAASRDAECRHWELAVSGTLHYCPTVVKTIDRSINDHTNRTLQIEDQ